MDLKGKRALVTGGASGIGREIVLALAEQGVDLAIHHNHSKKEAAELVGIVQGVGVSAATFQLDLKKTHKISKLVEEAAEFLGGLDILINNAGVFALTKLGETKEDDWNDLFDINLRAQYFLAQAAIEHLMKQESGKIVSIADVYAHTPAADFIPYGVSKAGVVALTKGLAKAFAPKICVNCVSPGAIAGLSGSRIPFEKVVDRTPLKRAGTPSDIVDAILYLLLSDYITGEEIRVDGGRHLI